MFNLEDYETVEVRLEKFIKDYPDFRVETELVSFQNDRYIVKAWLYRTFADSTPFSSGLAEETISSRGVNATSALENCETSAIGRALANAGYASKGKRPSREEMVKATRAKLTQPKEHIPVVNEDDPWTIKTVAPPSTSAEAVATVKEIIGGTTDKDIPMCNCGQQRVLRTGTSKVGKQWAAWDCPLKAHRHLNDGKEPCSPDRIWLELSPNGTWIPQKVRA